MAANGHNGQDEEQLKDRGGIKVLDRAGPGSLGRIRTRLEPLDEVAQRAFDNVRKLYRENKMSAAHQGKSDDSGDGGDGGGASVAASHGVRHGGGDAHKAPPSKRAER